MQKAVAAEVTEAAEATMPAATGTVLPVLISLGFCHMLNDLMQSLIPALYPMLKQQFQLDFTQVGMITLSFQLSSFLPAIGLVTWLLPNLDRARHPRRV